MSAMKVLYIGWVRVRIRDILPLCCSLRPFMIMLGVYEELLSKHFYVRSPRGIIEQTLNNINK